MICGGPGVSDAYYCKVVVVVVVVVVVEEVIMVLTMMQECVSLEKDRDGCPKIVNLGRSNPFLPNTLYLELQPQTPITCKCCS